MSRIALIGENSIEYVNNLINIWNNHNCAVLLDWRIPTESLIHMMREANVIDCIIEKTIFDKIANKPYDINYTVYEKSRSSSEVLPIHVYKKYRENYSKDEAIIIYSSGTTGKEKGIVLSHYAISTNADAIIEYMKPTSQDCIYIAKTISHSSTITGELLVALKSKMKLVIGPTIVPPRYVLSRIKEYRVSFLCINPTLLSMFSDELTRKKYDISTLKAIYVSGSILSDEVYKKSHKAFRTVPIYNVYGLSELGPRITAQRADCCNSNSVGKPIKNVKIAIISEKGTVLNNGEYGTIHVSTPSIFNRYVVGNQKHHSLYKKWYNTGDVGYIDSFGELHIVNRLDEIIIVNSHKVYPRDVEAQIIKHSSILECKIVKIELEGKEFIGCLYVGVKEIDQNIKKKLKERLMGYEIPMYFLKRDSLPKSNNGKILMKEVETLLKEHIKGEGRY